MRFGFHFFLGLGIFLLFYYSGVAQPSPGGTYKIKGRITDTLSKQPIGYAAVTVFLNGSTAVAGGMITDDNGNFIIENLPAGDYTVKVDYIGYNIKTTSGITLNDKHPVNNIGNLPISGSTKNLKDVTVTGTRNYMENHLDKLVYNVEKDVTSQGGIATDVLKKLPMVNVDIDGNVDLLGDPNVRVFINGKPSAMFDNNLAEALKMIPANQIKSIEVITSPGSQYDAQGTGGIINIILKDNKAKGINGNVSLSGGSRYQNGNGSIHVKNGGLDVSASVSGNMQLDTRTLTSLNRTADTLGLIQNGYGAVQRNGYRAQTGFDWAISKNKDINGSFAYNNFGNTNQGFVSQHQLTDGIDTPSTTNTNNYFRYRGEDWNMNYKKKFSRDGQEFNLSYQGSVGASDFWYKQYQTYTLSNSVFAGARGDNGFHDLENNLSADYAQPFSKDIMLNTGVKAGFSRMESTSDHYELLTYPGVYSSDPFQSNDFNFNRDIYAVYGTITFPLPDSFKMKIGVRDEYTINSVPGADFTIPSDNFITPSGIISRSLSHNQTIKLSYARRIQRPGYGQYNPFVNATDPTSLSTGNPSILPQKMHTGELSYYKFYDKGSNILVTLFYRYSEDDWQGYSTYYNNYTVGDSVYKNVTVNQTINAGTEQSGGLNLSGAWAVNEKLQIRPSASFFQKYIQSPLISNGSSGSFNYRANVNISYTFNKNLVAEFYSGYNSARYEAQGKFPSFASYSIAIRQQLWNKKGNLSFSATDPFNTYTNQISYVSASNFTSVSERRYPYQYFSLSFSYKFGKIEFTEKKPEADDGSEKQQSNPASGQ